MFLGLRNVKALQTETQKEDLSSQFVAVSPLVVQSFHVLRVLELSLLLLCFFLVLSNVKALRTETRKEDLSS